MINNLIENPFEILEADFADSSREILKKTRNAMISKKHSMKKLAGAQKELLNKDLKRAYALLFDEVPSGPGLKLDNTISNKRENFEEGTLFFDSAEQEFNILVEKWMHT